MTFGHSIESIPTTPWFFAPQGFSAGELVLLDRDEARHAAGSKRLTQGDAITLFDGHGHTASCIIRMIEKKGRDVTVEVGNILMAPEPAPFIELAFALPKGDRLNTLLSMAVPLGVNAVRPLRCARSVATFGENSHDRWRRVMIEACKQSRRAHLPEILAESPPEDAIISCQSVQRLPLLAHPTGQPYAEGMHSHRSNDLTLLIGPEGGFTAEEIDTATKRGAVIVSLGEGILRIETAAIAMLATARLAR